MKKEHDRSQDSLFTCSLLIISSLVNQNLTNDQYYHGCRSTPTKEAFELQLSLMALK